MEKAIEELKLKAALVADGDYKTFTEEKPRWFQMREKAQLFFPDHAIMLSGRTLTSNTEGRHFVLHFVPKAFEADHKLTPEEVKAIPYRRQKTYPPTWERVGYIFGLTGHSLFAIRNIQVYEDTTEISSFELFID